MHAFRKLQSQITQCNRCARLRTYCQEIAQKKKRAFREEVYWGRPVPGFGDIQASLIIVGLAPAAHGANRTGRMFTGDESGRWLYRALYEHGFSNLESSHHSQDDLELKGAFITAVGRCAPPGNKLTQDEINRCAPYLRAETKLLKRAKVYLCLGQIAFKAMLTQLKDQGLIPKELMPKKTPKFSHGLEISLGDDLWLMASYHPSQQNTFTKRLTKPMFDQVFRNAQKHITS